jgi:hypothetical protein
MRALTVCLSLTVAVTWKRLEVNLGSKSLHCLLNHFLFTLLEEYPQLIPVCLVSLRSRL